MTSRRRTLVWGVVLGLGLPVLLLALLGIEVLIARAGPDVAEPPDGVPDSPGGGRAVRALWLGDSTAAGVGVSQAAETLPLQVAERLGTPPNELAVLAVSGATVGDVVENQLPRVDVAADRVYVSVGANDVTHLTGTKAFRKTYEVLIDGVRALLGDDVEIVVLGVPDMGSPTRLAQPLRAVTGFRGRQLDREIRAMADGDPAITYVPIAAATGPTFRQSPSTYFAADRYHPSAAGYALWAGAVATAVRSAG